MMDVSYEQCANICEKESFGQEKTSNEAKLLSHYLTCLIKNIPGKWVLKLTF